MFHLTTAYVLQADREREVASDLSSRQLIRSASDGPARVESAPTVNRTTGRAPATRIRIASR